MLKLLQPGTLLRDRYRVLAPVGQGGMGAVYRAEDVRLEGRLCAVKEVQPNPGTDDVSLRQAQEQFHREASILARLDHPNLPKVSDFFSQNGRDFLVMDYVPGNDLRQAIGINEKFLFINGLFNGDLGRYNKAIDEFNELSTKEGVNAHFLELKIHNQWSDDNEGVVKLKALLDRKF